MMGKVEKMKKHLRAKREDLKEYGREEDQSRCGEGGFLLRIFKKLPRPPQKKVRRSMLGYIQNKLYMYSGQQFRWDRELDGLFRLFSILVFVLVFPVSIALIRRFGLLGFLLRKLGIDLDRDLWNKGVSTDSIAAQKRSQKGKMYRRIFTAVVDTHRPVVLQFDFHHRLEDAIFDLIRVVGTAHFVVEMIVDSARSLGIGRIVKVGLVAFHLAVESELGH
jgi:hypothetical protein